MTYLLDTNVFATLSQPRPHRSVERAFAKHVGELVTASIVVHEMWFGIERLPRSRRRAELERFMTEVVAGVKVLPYGERAARWHAVERARLAAAGRPPPFLDAQIAAIAAVHDATIVTGNAAHFESFEGLRIENWLA
ncbi:MAG TPA: type II toxin-antitoxin system VapC family toxin [Polyangiaceae bacterium]|jgi:tRNA(fMet)-specific endonuclease VapC